MIRASILLLAFIGIPATRSTDGLRTVPATAAQQRDPVKLLITEVRFEPQNGGAAFVELLNAGSSKVDVVRFLLRVNRNAHW